MSTSPAKSAAEIRVPDAAFVAGATGVAQLPAPTLAEIAFAGRSNVGKSSLLNAMMQRKSLARTSSTPGCTRQINVFEVRALLPPKEELKLFFVDLPGYGYAKRAKAEKAQWGPMIEGYLQQRPTLRAVALLVDARRGLEEDDRQLIDYLGPVNRNRPRAVDVVVVATKLDKLARSAQKPALAKLVASGGVHVIGFSAVTGDGRDALWARIRHAATT